MEGHGARICGCLRSSAGTMLKGKENIPVHHTHCLLPVSSSSAKLSRNCVCSSSLTFIRRLLWAVKKQAGEWVTRNRGYYNSYISSSCYTRNLSSLLLSLFDLDSICAYNLNLMCVVQSHRCASWSVLVLHSALWRLFDFPWALSLKSFLTGLQGKHTWHIFCFLIAVNSSFSKMHSTSFLVLSEVAGKTYCYIF